MKIIYGNLIDLALTGTFDVIIHGCNCQNTMGAGIAKQIKQAFPEAYLADLNTSKGDIWKLGTYSSALIVRNNIQFVVVNGYTQYDWKGQGVKVDYTAIMYLMRLVKRTFTGARIGYPAIGAGLAGGDWGIISNIVNEELFNEDHTLVLLK